MTRKNSFAKPEQKITHFSKLKRGDILFKYANDSIGDIITFLQAAVVYSEDEKKKIKKFEEALSTGGVNVRKLSHMLIYVGNGNVIEAIGDGIKMNSLVKDHNHVAKFEIFHCKNRELAKNAVEYAKLALAAGGKYNYDQLYGAIGKKIPVLIEGAVVLADKHTGGAGGWIKRNVYDNVKKGVSYIWQGGAKIIRGVSPEFIVKGADKVIDLVGDGYNFADGVLKSGLKKVAAADIKFLSIAAGVAKEVLTSNENIPNYEKRLKKLKDALRKEKVDPINFFCSELVAFTYDMACDDMGKPRLVDNSPSSMVTPLDFIIDLWFNDEFNYVGWLEPQTGYDGIPEMRTSLETDEYLQADEYLCSPNDKYRLIYNTNGNLEVKENFGSKTTVWQTGTPNTAAWLTFMQKDGNFVVYSSRTKKVAWASNVYNSSYTNSQLTLSDDGVIKIMNLNNNTQIWSSR